MPLLFWGATLAVGIFSSGYFLAQDDPAFADEGVLDDAADILRLLIIGGVLIVALPKVLK